VQPGTMIALRSDACVHAGGACKLHGGFEFTRTCYVCWGTATVSARQLGLKELESDPQALLHYILIECMLVFVVHYTVHWGEYN
jgi:hypothetical protein